jgi:hypothetical protein
MDSGYFDQAHLVRDFKSLTGLTPERFHRGARLRPPSASRLPGRIALTPGQ